jgi:hypothetical protein
MYTIPDFPYSDKNLTTRFATPHPKVCRSRSVSFCLLHTTAVCSFHFLYLHCIPGAPTFFFAIVRLFGVPLTKLPLPLSLANISLSHCRATTKHSRDQPLPWTRLGDRCRCCKTKCRSIYRSSNDPIVSTLTPSLRSFCRSNMASISSRADPSPWPPFCPNFLRRYVLHLPFPLSRPPGSLDSPLTLLGTVVTLTLALTLFRKASILSRRESFLSSASS